ncbi:hypothetical protein L915_04918 [Phytophthora nicotianae]|uniref:Uncharacterized protein n=1 Tax=Phytophthora nicotianae TaxID=4792 RepID=W2H8S0_PHYNI|nr:hypothetical protein L915_04918 [Phytophthora nicotianae]
MPPRAVMNLRVYKDIASYRNKQPLDSGKSLADIGNETTFIVELPPPRQPPLEQHDVIRVRVEEWFASDSLFSAPRRVKLDDADIGEDADNVDDDQAGSHDRVMADDEVHITMRLHLLNKSNTSIWLASPALKCRGTLKAGHGARGVRRYLRPSDGTRAELLGKQMCWPCHYDWQPRHR